MTGQIGTNFSKLPILSSHGDENTRAIVTTRYGTDIDIESTNGKERIEDGTASCLEKSDG